MPDVDDTSDLHTHSDLTDGAASPEAMADAALAAGLRTWGLSDHVRADSDWLPDYVRRVRAIERPQLTVRCGVEAKILDTGGRLDLPARLPALDYVLIADHQFPSAAGPVAPATVADDLRGGARTPAEVVDHLVQAMVAAVARSPFPAVLVHPFSLLPKMGLDEELLDEDHLVALAAACARAGAGIEINEKWRCPSPPVVARLVQLGVPLVGGSDAHTCAAVGAWDYVPAVLSAASLLTAPA